MAWTRAVWNEVDKDDMGEVFEQTVPSYWIINKTMLWPNPLDVKGLLKIRKIPQWNGIN